MGCASSSTISQESFEERMDVKQSRKVTHGRSPSKNGPSSPYKLEATDEIKKEKTSTSQNAGHSSSPTRKTSSSSLRASAKRREMLARVRRGSDQGPTQWTLARRDKIRSLGRKRAIGKRNRRDDESRNVLNCGDPSQLGGSYLKTSDFIMDSYAIGKGSFGFVILAKSKKNNLTYALKQTRKVDVIKKKGMKFVLRERKALRAIDNPFVVKLCGSFQDRACVYLVLEYVPGGDLGWLQYSKLNQRLPEDDARFYASEILVALQYMHSVGYMHRDVKPENILLDQDGHIKLGDFGFAKSVDKNGRCFTNLGTPHYLAPEQLDIHNKAGYTAIVDWWSYACLLFCLVDGECPFGKPDSTRYEVYLRVMKSKYRMSKHFSPPLKKMLKQMFLAKAEKRLTSVGEIRDHAFFRGVDWGRVESRSQTPPHKPDIQKNGKNNFTKITLRPLDDENDLAIVEKNYEMFAAFDRDK